MDEIGRGGFGRVYRAWDAALARAVALKVMTLPEKDDKGGASLLREGRLLARIRHPNVVTVYGATQVGEEIGIWMELVSGRTLASLVETDGPLGAEEAALVGVSLCRALAAVHGGGLIHRDVKAHNVMREAGGRIVLMDFGAGRELTDPSETGRWNTPGTPLYMAPECIAGQPASPSSDIYSLGVLLFYLVTGRYPVDARTFRDLVLAHEQGRRQLLADLRPDLPEAFVRVVERALAADPDSRYPSAGAMMADLTDSLAGSPPRAPASETSSGVTSRIEPALSPRAVERPRTPRRVHARISPRGVEIYRRSALWPAAGVAGGIVMAIGACGFLASMAFDVSLGRTGGFAGESPLSWWVWGLRALVAPAVYMALVVIAVLLISSAWRLVTRLSSRVRNGWDRVLERVRAGIRSAGLDDVHALAQVLFAVQLGLLALVWWGFGDLMRAYTTRVASAEPAVLAPLHPSQLGTHILYGQVLDVMLLGLGVTWWRLLRRRRAERIERGRATVVMGLAVLSLFLFLLVTPYRIIWHNEFERVAFEGARCYVTGQRSPVVLLYCPDQPAPARIRTAPADDPRLERPGIVESIFTSP